jgi:hypothetical protein
MTRLCLVDGVNRYGMAHRIAGVLLALQIAGCATPEAIAVGDPVSDHDRGEILDLACAGRREQVLALRQDPGFEGDKRRYKSVVVTCKPPDLGPGARVESAGRCDTSSGRWSCEDPVTSLSMRVFSGWKFILIDQHHEAASVQAIRCLDDRATERGKSFGGRDHHTIYPQSVTVNPDGSSTIEGYFRNECATIEIAANCATVPGDEVVKSVQMRGICWEE